MKSHKHNILTLLESDTLKQERRSRQESGKLILKVNASSWVESDFGSDIKWHKSRQYEQ